MTYNDAFKPEVAVMLQPLACAIYAVDQLGDVRGATVAVLGQGPIGVLFSHVLKQRGAATVIGVDRIDRSDTAKTFGVDEVVHASSGRWAHSLTDAARPDVIIEAVGHQVSTLTHTIEAVRFGGRIFYFGVPDDPIYPFPMNTFLRKNLTLHAGFTVDRRRVLAEADVYLTEHPALTQGYLTDVYPARQAQSAFQLASVPARGQMKVVLSMV